MQRRSFSPSMTAAADISLRLIVTTVAALNLAYFAVEIGVGVAIGSVSLLADGIDFLEDASVNLLILLALGWSVVARARVGMALAGVLLIPGIATVWLAVTKLTTLAPPAPLPLTLAGLGALAVNLTCALLLARHRHVGGSLLRAAFLSSRNDCFANVAIIAAGLVTVVWHSAWPDLIVGIGIGVLNLGAAHEVWTAARAESKEARP